MAERVPGSPEPPGAQDSAPNTIQLINVLVMREGETVSAKWGIHPQLKKDLIPAEWEELSEHMNRVTAIVFPSSFDNCSTNFAPTMAVTRFMCSESSSHSAGIRSFLSCGWIPHLALTVSPSRMTSTLINWMVLGAPSCAPDGWGDPGTRSAMVCSLAT